jgi:hypothetical protein
MVICRGSPEQGWWVAGCVLTVICLRGPGWGSPAAICGSGNNGKGGKVGGVLCAVNIGDGRAWRLGNIGDGCGFGVWHKCCVVLKLWIFVRDGMGIAGV